MKQPDALQLSQDPDLSDEKVKRRAWFVEVIVGLHEKLAALDDGRPADYIPQLAEVDPDQFAIAAFTTDGAAVGVGDTEHAFTIQSVSKLLTYGLALETHGREAVRGLCHITGGGFTDNIPRVIPDGLCVHIDPTAWTPLPIFTLIGEKGGVDQAEMHRVFNMGIGLVVIAPPGVDLAAVPGSDAIRIGEVKPGATRVALPF